MKKILIYSHDTYGLGNIRRMLAIATFLSRSRPDYSILILSGSPMLHSFRIPERIDYVKLPCLGRTQGGQYVVRSLDMEYDAIVRLRANIIQAALLDFQPDLLLVDKKPLGLSNELQPALEAMQTLARPPRCVMVLRDILDAPATTQAEWAQGGYHQAIERYYDQLLVVGSAEVFNLGAEYRFPAATRAKLRYCGYVHRELNADNGADVRQRYAIGDAPLVVLTAGGGADGFALLSAYMQGPARHPPVAGQRTLVLCGPEMMAAHRQQIERWAAECRGVQVLEFSNDVMSLLDAADLVVSMGGYNTVCEILSLGKRALIVPRVAPVEEQWIRCQRMEALGLLRALHPQQLQPERLCRVVGEELASSHRQSVPVHRLEFDGLGRMGWWLERLLAQAEPPVAAAESPRDTVPFLFPEGVLSIGGWQYGSAS
ncbi:glycosyltransferase family protein [Motiliproteus sediminis]|uniref:glycosyltransferase family protein n=1 Tax=Motiliproteus sediminis TaxID=1468178 RepID=UPI001AEFA37F|nr:glycosyltransferase [Motiliproteus sediminis]